MSVRLSGFVLTLCLRALPMVSAHAFIAPPPPVDGVNYYVSANTGDDANPGTSARPFRTLGRIAPFMQPGQVCVVRAGVYRETLRPGRGGEEGRPITFTAAPGEEVVLTGLDMVGGWTPATDFAPGAWRAAWPSTLPASRTQVFFDGAIGYEARWPNRTDDNLLDPQGAPMTGGDTTTVASDSMPAGLPADYFEGGVVWALAGKKWSSWRSPVTAFDPATKTITFKPFAGTRHETWVHKNHMPASKPDDLFYVSGARRLLDAEREWYYDAATGELLVVPPAGFGPATSRVELQTRAHAIDLAGLGHVVVEGFKVVGAAANLSKSNHCVLERLDIRYPSFTRGDFGTNGTSAPGGVAVDGEFNIVRECRISWSWTSGITLNGSGHRVINNLMEDVDLLGIYASGIDMTSSSRENLVAWNTVNRAGRDGMRPNGHNHRVIHNRISRFGSICDDTGGIYLAGGGSGVVVAYNWIHDTDEGMKVGVYLDNFTAGIVVHHNVTWNLSGNGITLNRPSAYNLVAHNTLFGDISNYYGPWKAVRNTSPGTRLVNNWINGDMGVSYGAEMITNLVGAVGGASTDSLIKDARFPLNLRPVGIGAGTRVPVISPVATGVAPDIGAFQTGVDYPVPGYDATRRPESGSEVASTPLAQRLKNNLFLAKLEGWTPGTHGTASIVKGEGYNFPGPETRDSILGEGLALTGATREEPDGRVASVSQVVKDLTPGAVYSLWAFRKATEQSDSGVTVSFPDGTVYRHVFDAAALQWQLSDGFEFVVPAGQTEASVELWINGPGSVFFDHLGLMQKFPDANR
ncbi:MAG: right-handed parallel beta-helix repeat-containing protein [Verrucomicrobiota bacterium]